MLEDAKTLWSAKKGGSTSFNRTVKLLDSGNLVLIEGQVVSEANILWQSFDLPTDTFLPGMKMSSKMLLTSWKSQDDPAPGDFIFKTEKTSTLSRKKLVHIGRMEYQGAFLL